MNVPYDNQTLQVQYWSGTGLALHSTRSWSMLFAGKQYIRVSSISRSCTSEQVSSGNMQMLLKGCQLEPGIGRP